MSIIDIRQINASNFLYAHYNCPEDGNIIVLVPEIYWKENKCIMDIDLTDNLSWEIPADMYEEYQSTFSVEESCIEEVIEQLENLGVKKSEDLLMFLDQ